jgi:hypothetical protein
MTNTVSISPAPLRDACYIRKRQKTKVIAKSTSYAFCFLEEIDQSNSIFCTDSDPVKQLTFSGLSDIHFEDFIQELSQQLRFWILLV